jgi:hypothetical protein
MGDSLREEGGDGDEVLHLDCVELVGFVDKGGD